MTDLMMGLNIQQQWWDHAYSLLPTNVSLKKHRRYTSNNQSGNHFIYDATNLFKGHN